LVRCLDTSFLVDFLRGVPSAVERAKELEMRSERLIVPSPAAYEVLEGGMSRGGAHLARALALIASADVMPVDLQVASEAARITSEGRRSGHQILGLDALIAATATAHQLVLISRDDAFRHVKGLAVEKY
jgi:predicted nucleic acid-binding protein